MLNAISTRFADGPGSSPCIKGLREIGEKGLTGYASEIFATAADEGSQSIEDVSLVVDVVPWTLDKAQAHTMSIGVHAELKVSDKSRKQDTLYGAERYLLHRGTSAALVIAHTPRQRSSALQQQQLPSLSRNVSNGQRESPARPSKVFIPPNMISVVT
ncbi:hypothetical protein DAPPUDRAFT_233734 [Daphnia pulex]|uniref:Uncharacterized protein n=1 Tax=Daphnia pulex TaxID=6669 RepID=E9FVK3_DAPPU|nr:hypothetical protein DAPPUDRAFT_233734 [Daphnia pulex]|eukprot:EFX88570.1 hypothetical protein DAPPUDRAFT_233734 [Daphnia pulex]